jgi:hypothetical protein
MLKKKTKEIPDSLSVQIFIVFSLTHKIESLSQFACHCAAGVKIAGAPVAGQTRIGALLQGVMALFGLHNTYTFVLLYF